ncbi:hypothetical protein OkiPb00131_45940 [Escherichia coli]
MGKYKRILLRLTMKNGLELKAPVTDDVSRALAFAIKWVAVGIAVSPMLYGLAKLVHCVEIVKRIKHVRQAHNAGEDPLCNRRHFIFTNAGCYLLFHCLARLNFVMAGGGRGI